MSAANLPIIRCPVCQSHGATLHHDLRASLMYSCLYCLHAWQIAPAEAPPRADITVRVVQIAVPASAQLSASSPKKITDAGP
jgi:hypothetical protein